MFIELILITVIAFMFTVLVIELYGNSPDNFFNIYRDARAEYSVEKLNYYLVSLGSDRIFEANIYTELLEGITMRNQTRGWGIYSRNNAKLVYYPKSLYAIAIFDDTQITLRKDNNTVIVQ